jgi:putative peptidoglycan lipid II flippase
MTLLRSIVTVGGYTMASRVLGFVRDVLIARLLGTGPVADAFFLALRFPNLFRRLFAEGAFNSAFVPLFARAQSEDGRAVALRFADEVLAVMAAGLLLLTALAQATMPWLMVAIAPGLLPEPAQFDLVVRLTIITFPYLLFMSLAALMGGILNSLSRFAHAAAAPVLLNVILIVALVVVVPFMDAPGTHAPGEVLAWGVAAAGLAQFLWLVIACRRAGVHLHLPRPRLTPGVRRLFRMMVPGMVGGGVTQINLLIGTVIATLEPGAVSYLYYADRIYQLPLGVIGAAVGVVLLPEMSRHLRSGNPGGASAAFNRGMEFALLLTLPATAALFVIADPVIAVLYERGAFGAEARAATAAALAAFALGLPAYVLIKALSPAFFAREDTTTPFYFAAVGVAVNIALSLALFPFVKALGIALATAGSAWVNAALLGWRLHRLGHLALDDRLRRNLWRIGGASLAMGLSLAVATALLADALAGPPLAKAGALAALVVGGAALYGALVLATGVVTPAELRRRFGRPGA